MGAPSTCTYHGRESGVWATPGTRTVYEPAVLLVVVPTAANGPPSMVPNVTIAPATPALVEKSRTRPETVTGPLLVGDGPPGDCLSQLSADTSRAAIVAAR